MQNQANVVQKLCDKQDCIWIEETSLFENDRAETYTQNSSPQHWKDKLDTPMMIESTTR